MSISDLEFNEKDILETPLLERRRIVEHLLSKEFTFPSKEYYIYFLKGMSFDELIEVLQESDAKIRAFLENELKDKKKYLMSIVTRLPQAKKIEDNCNAGIAPDLKPQDLEEILKSRSLMTAYANMASEKPAVSNASAKIIIDFLRNENFDAADDKLQFQAMDMVGKED